MSNEVVFYLSHQNGDIISSVQYVRYIVDHMGDNFNFFYIHGKDPESVFIHEKVKHFHPGMHFHSLDMNIMKNFLSKNNVFTEAIWVDVWLGTLNGCREVLDDNGVQRWIMPNIDGSYVLGDNDIFDNIEWQRKICNQNINIINNYFILNFSNKKIPYPTYTDLVKKRNKNPRKKTEADRLINDIEKYSVKIFIANSNTESLQRENFSYEDYLIDIYDKYSDVAFVFSNNYKNIEKKNVFYIDKYINFPNLNEIDYMSKYFDILVTSSSGPGFMIFNDDVFNNYKKTLIYVKRKIIGLYNDRGHCKYVETENYSKENIVHIIVSNIEEKLK
jgi:hypothetical protein